MLIDSEKLKLWDYIENNPLALSFIKDEDSIRYVRDILPYSIGFEIECDQKPTYDLGQFKEIPYIMDVDVGSSEQRYRIPYGIAGFICLYFISLRLSTNSLLNSGSGIHYHCDFTDCYHQLSEEFIATNSYWVLQELDKWEYKGTYNRRDCLFSLSNVWVRFQSSFKTMEIRAGEMTFDYKLLIKRIIHVSEIAKRLKTNLQGYDIVNKVLDLNKDITIDNDLIANYIIKYPLTLQLNKTEITKKETELKEKIKSFEIIEQKKPQVDMKSIIQARTIKL